MPGSLKNKQFYGMGVIMIGYMKNKTMCKKPHFYALGVLGYF